MLEHYRRRRLLPPGHRMTREVQVVEEANQRILVAAQLTEVDLFLLRKIAERVEVPSVILDDGVRH